MNAPRYPRLRRALPSPPRRVQASLSHVGAPSPAARAALAVVLAALALALLPTRAVALDPPAPTESAGLATFVDGRPHRVTWDRDSLMIDGRRIFVWAGEFDYWRLPSPGLWRDVLEKIKAAGFNTVSIYFHWGYHSPRRGVYDFSGVRDVGRLLDMAKEVGLYVIARPGPYINAATDAGGFPGWLLTQRGRSRSSAPDYLAAAREWLHRIDAILAPRQITRGGPIIVDQIENEYSFGPLDANYMTALEQTVRSDGIDVPLVHNDGSPSGRWAAGPGAPDLYGFSSYPSGFSCADPGDWATGNPRAPDRFKRASRRAAPDDPVSIVEYQGGVIDTWGGTGYDRCRQRTGVPFQRVYNSTAVAQEARLISRYMLFGGTNWGWLPFAPGYTSWDYGAAITEARRLTPKYAEDKRLGLFLGAAAPLRRARVVSAPVGSNPAVLYRRLRDPRTRTQFVILRHLDPTSTSDDMTTLSLFLRDGVYPRVPQRLDTAIRVRGRDAKILTAAYSMGGQRLVYSTSELTTHAAIAGSDVAVLAGRPGEPGETVLRFARRPSVRVLAGRADVTWDGARGDLRLNYFHGGLIRLLVSGGGRRPLLLELGDGTAVARLWRQDTPAGPVLERGPELVRTATIVPGPPTTAPRAPADTLALRGDTDRRTRLVVLAPARVARLSWNGRLVPAVRGRDGSLSATLPGPAPVALPPLTDWRFRGEAPERRLTFDDSAWLRADHTATNNPTPSPTLPVLYQDDYGFHYGAVWYRAHFTATGGETAIVLNGRVTGAGQYSVWFNGRYLGSGRGERRWAFPPGALRVGGDNVVAVLTEQMGHERDLFNDESQKQPRGLVSAALEGAPTPMSWRIQGARGGERLADPVRGPYNTSGLWGERAGWYLPGAPLRGWTPVTLPYRLGDAGLPAGVGWYRTAFDLDLPAGQDVPVGLELRDFPCRYRARIFLNGWQVGRYINTVGPQHVFPLPTGILNPGGRNELAISVWGEAATCAGLAVVRLVPLGNVRGGPPVELVNSPGYAPPAPVASRR